MLEKKKLRIKTVIIQIYKTYSQIIVTIILFLIVLFNMWGKSYKIFIDKIEHIIDKLITKLFLSLLPIKKGIVINFLSFSFSKL